ncbi:hypothetical protein SAMN05421690_10587 [Nitrosomonas sp. Nm51]|uniref:hypothetical protein n=1 Tax=Nitrosomonas sp. Nm51 TaxID=133720 RepID=UPI0008AE0A2B|nr:hypothetical protein [Nitrosomonas sp. Nm51]SER71396.1 hypothetical protein SAMN05421690_10587 [Nitrosomonas sp. Nm51]
MKKLILIFFAIPLLGILMYSQAAAHGGRIDRFNFGIHFGYPGYLGYGYYDPYFYPSLYSYPPVVVPMTPPVIVQSTPPVYIQQHEQPTPGHSQTNYWYYCQDPDGYYPYVKQCPGGWLRVNPHPPEQK